MYASYHPYPFDLNMFYYSFGELALLFPNTDIDMVMYGSSAYKIVQRAKPPAIAARQYVYEFSAPKECGSGSIRIQLYDESEIWDGPHISSYEMIPDALIALNAGISTFGTWRSVFETSRLRTIPFAVTDHSRLCLAQDKFTYKSWLEIMRAVVQGPSGIVGTELTQLLVKSLDYEPSVAINPFMRPGNMVLMTNQAPHAINGFSCIVTPRF